MSATRNQAQRSTPHGSGERSRPLAFVAEDDESMRSLLVAGLNKDELEVIEVGSGSELLDRLRRVRERDQQPAIIVADIRMPGATGLEVLCAVRSWGWKIPFLLITAFPDDETLAAAADAGATVVFSKPFDIDDLRTAVVWFLPRPTPPAV